MKTLDVPISYTVEATSNGIWSVLRRSVENITKKELAISTMTNTFQIQLRGSKHQICQLI